MSAALTALPEPRHLPVLAPRTRGECAGGARPCPWACRYSLRGERRWRQGVPSCALDIADAGATTVEAVADILGVTPERVRQLQQRALRRFAAAAGVLR